SRRPVRLAEGEPLQLRGGRGSPFGVAVLAEGLIEAIGERGLLEAFGSEDALRRYGKVERDAHGHLRLGEIEFGRMVRDHLAKRLAAHGIKLPLTLVDKDLGYELRCADPISASSPHVSSGRADAPRRAVAAATLLPMPYSVPRSAWGKGQ